MKLDLDPSQFNEIPDPLVNGGAGLPLPPQPTIPKSSLLSLPGVLGVPGLPRATAGIRRGAALAIAIVSQLVWVEILSLRRDLVGSARSRLALEFALPLATAAIAFWAGGAPGPRGLGNTRGRIAAAIAAALMLFWGGTWWMTAVEETDAIPFWFHAGRCAAYITAFATVPFALALWAHARAFVTLSSWRTCALGIGCGAIGACTMSFVCETESAAHVIIGHGLAMVIGGLAGAIAARPATMA